MTFIEIAWFSFYTISLVVKAPPENIQYAMCPVFRAFGGVIVLELGACVSDMLTESI